MGSSLGMVPDMHSHAMCSASGPSSDNLSVLLRVIQLGLEGPTASLLV